MNSYLNRTSMAVLLLCSQIGLDMESTAIKPFTVRQWTELSGKLKNSSLKSPEAFFDTTQEDWKRNLNIGTVVSDRIKTLLSRAAQLEEGLEELQGMGIYVTTRAERDYPERLKARLKDESPPVLYYSGNLEILEFPSLAVFSSTYSDDASLKFAKVLAEKCAMQGITVLTGGGLDVDSIAEASALRSGGKAVCIVTYEFIQRMKQEELQSAISAGNLLLMSAEHPRAPLTLRSSMEKNKYLFGLADYAVVISAENKKGLTYNGALENLERQWAPLFVRKDDNMPEGNAALLEMGEEPFETGALLKTDFSLSNFLNHQGNIPDTTSACPDIQDEAHQDVQYPVIDLFPVVWPYIEQTLKEPRTRDEICEMLNLKKGQLSIWLKRALKEGKIKKYVRPVLYTLADKFK